MNAPSFTCPRCGRESHNPNDVREGYCGNCHDWTGPDGRPTDTARPARPDTLTQEEIGLLIEALDSHAYWQLSEPEHRDSGYVRPEGETPEIKACYALESKLRKHLA